MEAREPEVFLVMCGVRKMCSYLLRRYYLDFVLKILTVEAASNQRVITIWVLQCFLIWEFFKPLYDKVSFKFRWQPRGIHEYLLDSSRVPVTFANYHMAVSDRKRGWAEDSTALGKLIILSCFCVWLSVAT